MISRKAGSTPGESAAARARSRGAAAETARQTDTMQRLAGNWAGTYTYLEPEVPGSRLVSFRLKLFDGFPWRLNGEVWDDPAVGMEGQGIISGWSWGRHVWFRKTMRSLQVAHDPKPIALDDYVQAHYGERIEGDPGIHVVSYRGVMAQNEACVTGVWRMPHRRLVLASKRVIVFPFARGTWQMRHDDAV